MGLRARIVACAVAAALMGPACAQANIVNGSFEHNFDGWTVSDDGLVFDPGGAFHLDPLGAPDSGEYGPVGDGYFIAKLDAGARDQPTFISQTFTTRGGVLTGSAAFLGEDFGQFDDHAFVRLLDAGSQQVLFSTTPMFSASIGTVGDYGFTPWTLTFPLELAAGRYTLEAGVVNVGSNMRPSYLLLDDFNVAEVPEPTTWALMLTGFFGLGAMLRRQRQRLQPVRIRRD